MHLEGYSENIYNQIMMIVNTERWGWDTPNKQKFPGVRTPDVLAILKKTESSSLSLALDVKTEGVFYFQNHSHRGELNDEKSHQTSPH